MKTIYMKPSETPVYEVDNSDVPDGQRIFVGVVCEDGLVRGRTWWTKLGVEQPKIYLRSMIREYANRYPDWRSREREIQKYAAIDSNPRPLCVVTAEQLREYLVRQACDCSVFLYRGEDHWEAWAKAKGGGIEVMTDQYGCGAKEERNP